MACTIEPLIARNVLMVKDTTTVLEATQQMVCKGAGSVVVTDDGNNVVGFFTERDLLTRVISRNLNPGDVGIREEAVIVLIYINNYLKVLK